LNFVSLEFWITLGIFVLAYFPCRLLSHGFKNQGLFERYYLLFTSLTLFGLEDPTSLLLFLLISTFIFICQRTTAIAKNPSKWVGMIVGIIAVLPLLWFKYAPLVMQREITVIKFTDLVIPIGLSFYTFQLIALFIDQRKLSLEGKSTSISLLNFLNFASFFPQIVAGPIERRDHLLPQLKDFRISPKIEELETGLKLIILGFFYKLVLADGLAASAPWIVEDSNQPWIIHLSNVIFGLRIYGDFCGYSLIAVGVARLVGIRLTWNFQSPYTQRNIRDFWRAWHITLTNWFRDYIYIPLGGNRNMWAILTIFLISGVWHGAGWNFVVWGAIHGVLVMFFNHFGSRGRRIPNALSWAITMLVVSFAWLFFYQWQSDILTNKIYVILSPAGYLINPLPELLLTTAGMGNLIYLVCCLSIGGSVIFLEFLGRKHWGGAYQWGMGNSAQVVLLSGIIFLTPLGQNGFVYFNF
jgi:D-alanyl-lipoteichoic acid acyltransferase DltB (MBOAT superfamily)